MRSEKNKFLILVCGLCSLAAFAGLAAHRFATGILKPALFESLLILTVCLVFFTRRNVAEFFLGLSRPVKAFSAVFFLLILTGQAASVNSAAFPFVSWTMYGAPKTGPVAQFLEYRGIAASGKRVFLSPGRLFPSLKRNMLDANLERLSGAFGPDDGPSTLPDAREDRLPRWLKDAGGFLRPHLKLDRGEMKKRAGEILEALALRHNRAHPGDPVLAVEIVRGRVDIGQKPRPFPVYEILGVYELSERRFR